jgi:hypothetical protein
VSYPAAKIKDARRLAAGNNRPRPTRERSGLG